MPNSNSKNKGGLAPRKSILLVIRYSRKVKSERFSSYLRVIGFLGTPKTIFTRSKN